VAPPSGPSFTLNSAVDGLLKREFDVHRKAQTIHPEIDRLGYEFIPYPDDRMNAWRKTTVGVRFHDPATNFILFGAIDDLWTSPDSELLHVIDYKTTSKDSPVTELGNAHYHDAYRRQLDIYNFLLAKNEVQMSKTAYWYYATARKGANAFNLKLEFDATLLAYECNTSWIPAALEAAKAALQNPVLVDAAATCETCQYIERRGTYERPMP